MKKHHAVLLFMTLVLASPAPAQKRKPRELLDATGTWTSKTGTLSAVQAGDSLSFSYTAVFGATAHTCDGIGVAVRAGDNRFEYTDSSGSVVFTLKKGAISLEPGTGVASFCGANWPGDAFDLDGYEAPDKCTVSAEKALFYAVGVFPPEPRKGFVLQGDTLETIELKNEGYEAWVLARFKGKTSATAGLVKRDEIRCLSR